MLVVVRTSCASCWGYNLLFVSAKVTVRGRVDGSACSQVWDVWLLHMCYQFAAHVVSQHVWAGGMGMGMGNGMGHWQWPGVLLIVVSHWTWALAMLGAWGGVHVSGLQACTLSCIALVDISYHTTFNQALVL